MRFSFRRVYRRNWLRAFPLPTKKKRKPAVELPELKSSDADAVWQECVEKGLYGAKTTDYTMKDDLRPKRH